MMKRSDAILVTLIGICALGLLTIDRALAEGTVEPGMTKCCKTTTCGDDSVTHCRACEEDEACTGRGNCDPPMWALAICHSGDGGGGGDCDADSLVNCDPPTAD